jgi:hypothetical protein
VATKQPPKVVVIPPATQQTPVTPPELPTQPVVVATPLDMPPPPTTNDVNSGIPSIFGVPKPPVASTTAPAIDTPPLPPPPVAQTQQPVQPPAVLQPQVKVMPSPVVSKVTELTWVGDYQAIPDTDSLAAPMAVLKRTAEAETIELLGADKMTAVVSFRRDQAASEKYVVSPAGDTVARAVAWPKPGLQLWTVADNKPGKTTDLDLPEATIAPLCFASADTVVVHRTLTENHAIQLFNVKTGQKVREQRTPALFDNGYAVSPDGKTLAIATKPPGGGPQLHLIELASGRTKKLPIPIAPQWPVTPAGVAFSVDASRIGMVFEQDGNVLAVAWNTASGVKTQEHVYPAGTLPIPPRTQYKGRGLDWLADGVTWIVCGSVVIDVPSGQAMGSLRVGGVTNQRVVEGKKIYLEAGGDAGVKRIVTVELNADAITKMRANLTQTK